MNIKKLFSMFTAQKSAVVEKTAAELAAVLIRSLDEINDIRSKIPDGVATPVKMLYFEMPEIGWRLSAKDNKSWIDYTLRKTASQLNYHAYHLFLAGARRSGHIAEVSINKLTGDKYEAVFFSLTYSNEKPSKKAIFYGWQD